MGATTFMCGTYSGSAETAYNFLVEEAYYNYGHNGYTGTIAEKSGYKKAGEAETNEEAMKLAGKLLDEDDSNEWGKYNPAGYIEVKSKPNNYYLFFGWARY